MSGRPEEIARFDAWLAGLPHRHKVVIAGNHDFLFEGEPERARRLLPSAIYLRDEGVELDGFRFWGSPWQPWFHDWAFNLPRGPALAAKWALIPARTDVLLTHGPPHGILDRTVAGEPVGCEELTLALARVRPRLHVFGHIHEAYGRLERDGTLFVNASNLDVHYRPVQAPVVIEL
jgi:predicted phosphohydrolase